MVKQLRIVKCELKIERSSNSHLAIRNSQFFSFAIVAMKDFLNVHKTGASGPENRYANNGAKNSCDYTNQEKYRNHCPVSQRRIGIAKADRASENVAREQRSKNCEEKYFTNNFHFLTFSKTTGNKHRAQPSGLMIRCPSKDS